MEDYNNQLAHCVEVPIGQRGPVLQVHRHRCNHGLERHTAPLSRSCRYVTRLRLIPQFSSLAAYNTIACDKYHHG
jgi:hypothetical protein